MERGKLIINKRFMIYYKGKKFEVVGEQQKEDKKVLTLKRPNGKCHFIAVMYSNGQIGSFSKII